MQARGSVSLSQAIVVSEVEMSEGEYIQLEVIRRNAAYIFFSSTVPL